MEFNDIPPSIAVSISKGDAVLFLGAGASYGSTGKKGESTLNGNQLRDAICDEFLGGDLKMLPLAQVAELAKNDSSQENIEIFISSLFEPLYPAEFHSIMSSFRWHAIVTVRRQNKRDF